MSKTIHIEGVARNIDILGELSDNYDFPHSFDFDEPSADTLPNVFFRFYESDAPCSLKEAMKNNLEIMWGSLHVTGIKTGYSEYTITGFDVRSLHLGGHNMDEVIKSKGDKYLHILIDIVE